MATYNELIYQYRKVFSENNLSPETVKVFIFELCNEYQINLYLDIDSEVDNRVLDKFNKGIVRLLNNEPLNYVLGYSYFYGYKLKVDENVLIPRVETEELTSLVLSKYDEYYKGQVINICDVGTGSGAIAIALNKEEKNLRVYASDISETALNVAEENALNNQCSIEFLQGSMLQPYIDRNLKFEILVSNPPYIKNNEDIESSVFDYEPHVALFGGEDGLDYYRQIFSQAKKIMKDNALLFFEMGYDQKERLSLLCKEYFPDCIVNVYKDINKKDRMLMLKL